MPLRYVAADVGAHEGAVVVGAINSITRDDATGAINALGVFDAGSPAGVEAIRQVKSGLTTGISMDLDDVSFEIRVASDMNNPDESILPIGEVPGTPLSQPHDAPLIDNAPAASPSDPSVDDAGRVTVATIASDGEVMVTTSGRIRAATIVAIPAFSGARIALSESSSPLDPAVANSSTLSNVHLLSVPGDKIVLVAAGSFIIPNNPPKEWFANPQLRDVTPLKVEKDGRVYGHLADWRTCHTAHSGSCVRAPRSKTHYAYFRTGSLITAEGVEISVGHLTLDGNHAGSHLSAAQTSAHYENTGAVVADVAAGEDEYGIWVAGALRPHVSEAHVRALRSAPLSGDWRRISGNLELVAALAVNVPGFPIPRTKGLVASGVLMSLVASGAVSHEKDLAKVGAVAESFTEREWSYMARVVERERANDQRKGAMLARRVAASSLAMRVQAVRHSIVSGRKK